MEGSTPRKSTMNIVDSDLGYLGYNGAESYGVAYKARGCGIDAQNICAVLDVGGKETGSRFHDNFMGTYTWGAQDILFDRNTYSKNKSYGLDPHDDSDHLTITNNVFSENSNHGLICSQRCDHLIIKNNKALNNGHTPYVGPGDDDPSDNQVHGIMLHRGITDTVVEDNDVRGQVNGGGIVVFDSIGNTVRGNRIDGNKYGLRFSVGTRDLVVADNTVIHSTGNALSTFKGTDSPVYTGTSGRPSGITFTGNTFDGAGLELFKVQDSDSFTFTGGSITPGAPARGPKFERSAKNIYDRSVATPPGPRSPCAAPRRSAPTSSSAGSRPPRSWSARTRSARPPSPRPRGSVRPGVPMNDLDPDEFRRQAHAVVDWIADYRAGLADRPVSPSVRPGWVRSQLPAELPETPQPVQALLDELDRVVLPASTHWQHPGFFGYFPANASLHSLLGDMLSAGLGAQGMLWSTSPAVTEVEQVLLDGFAGALGLGDEFTFGGGGGGCIQDSASSASLVALLAALHRTSGGSWRDTGVDGRERVYLTAETHSSVAKAARVAGLGSGALHVVEPSPGGFDMSPDALAAALAADVAAGRRPVMVCATVGSTGTGAVDRLREIGAVARAHGAWVHVDAAWAGVAALCPEHRSLLDGVELADSFCTDAHKWLLTAFDASLLWVRDGQALPAALSITPEYLRNPASESGAVVDYRDWQVPLGRRFRALKLWAVVNGYGLTGLREHLRAGTSRWPRSWPNGCAPIPGSRWRCRRHSPWSACGWSPGDGPAADDAATRAVLERVNASGAALLTHTVVDGRYVIRVAIGSVATRPSDVTALWKRLSDEAAAVLTGAD